MNSRKKPPITDKIKTNTLAPSTGVAKQVITIHQMDADTSWQVSKIDNAVKVSYRSAFEVKIDR